MRVACQWSNAKADSGVLCCAFGMFFFSKGRSIFRTYETNTPQIGNRSSMTAVDWCRQLWRVSYWPRVSEDVLACPIWSTRLRLLEDYGGTEFSLSFKDHAEKRNGEQHVNCPNYWGRYAKQSQLEAPCTWALSHLARYGPHAPLSCQVYFHRSAACAHDLSSLCFLMSIPIGVLPLIYQPQRATCKRAEATRTWFCWTGLSGERACSHHVYTLDPGQHTEARLRDLWPVHSTSCWERV